MIIAVIKLYGTDPTGEEGEMVRSSLVHFSARSFRYTELDVVSPDADKLSDYIYLCVWDWFIIQHSQPRAFDLIGELVTDTSSCGNRSFFIKMKSAHNIIHGIQCSPELLMYSLGYFKLCNIVTFIQKLRVTRNMLHNLCVRHDPKSAEIPHHWYFSF